MKSFRELSQARRASHHFVPSSPLSNDDIREILEPVALTPSGYNAQPWEVVVIREPERLLQLQAIAMGQAQVTAAGNAFIFLADTEFGTRRTEEIVAPWQEFREFSDAQASALRDSLKKPRTESKKREMALRNASLALGACLYSATDLGYATCPMMGVKQLELKRWLSLPDHLMFVGLVAIGRTANPEPARLPRRDLEDWVHWESLGAR